MRVFLTGATGFIGSAIVKELLKAGHHPIGLARNDAAVQKLEAAGVEVHNGHLEDLESIKRGAAKADAVIHTGFIHDFTDFKKYCEVDRSVIEAMGEVVKGPIVVASGTALIARGTVTTELDQPVVSADLLPRVATEEAVAAVVARGGNASLVRLTPTVHGNGDQGFIPIIINAAKTRGAAFYIGEGQNRWPAVHRDDAARLFVLAMEQSTPGAIYHAVAEEGITTKELAGVMAKHLDMPLKSITAEEAGASMGFFGIMWSMDQPSSSKITQEKLGWQPKEIGLIADMEANYFK
ncbi:SDR family oxidoreductase [Chitinophaga sp.]|uniref:SDR family oxidoreductase n=1 Tax=Chitinophaga sp. TaxID=1869181 RepID=UPI0031DD2E51